jgi:ketosteroid isomerase-like protein
VQEETAGGGDIRQILDRIAIEDCLHRYCHAVDRCDAELLRSVYWPDATDDHVFWSGGAMDFIDFCMPILRSRDQTLHAISNILIRIAGDGAVVQCYYNAIERVRGRDGRVNDVTFLGRYLDRFERREGEWRIRHRQVMIDSWRVYDDSCDWDRGVFGTRVVLGRRGQDDPSAQLFGAALLDPPF